MKPPVNNLNRKTMIQQLKVLPLWPKFELWYNMQDFRVPQSDNLWPPIMSFEHDYSFEFQKGVFEKFLNSMGYIVCYQIKYGPRAIEYRLYNTNKSETRIFSMEIFSTLEELLLWAFNNTKK